MRVLVDALPARDGGGVTYLIEELRALKEVARKLELDVLASPWGYDALAAGVPWPVERVGVKTVADRFLYQQAIVPWRSRRYDVLFCPLNFGPTIWGGRHAVLTLHNPHYFGAGLVATGTESARPWIKVKACHAAVRSARAVIAISSSFQKEILHTLPEAEPKLHVLKSGRAEWDKTPALPVKSVPDKFLLVVASAAPHKRVEVVVAAWARAVQDTGAKVGLVIAGVGSRAVQDQHRKLAAGSEPLLSHLGPVADRGALRWLYENAIATVSMSVLEAFPLTLVEAGGLGCPLILSDIPPHREVSLGRAVFVPADDARTLASEMIEAFEGHLNAQHWEWPLSWGDHAQRLLTLFDEVAA